MNNSEPKISVITASFNYAEFIFQTIESVINQTYKNWELIIVDDGSSDNSREIIQKYCNEYEQIKLITHENIENKGLSETVKLGCQIAQGEYIAFLESDDIFGGGNHLQEKVLALQNYPNLPLIFNAVELFGDEASYGRLEEYFKFQKFFLKKQNYPAKLFNYFLFINLIPTFSCVMIKKEVLLNLDFNAPFQQHLDWFLWMQISYNNEIYYLDLPLTKWRIHPQSFIGRTQKIKKNNNKIINEKITAVVSNSKRKNPIIKWFLINYYSTIMILLKMNKSLIKKVLNQFIDNQKA